MNKLNKLADDLVLLDTQDRLKMAFKLIGSVMLEEPTLNFKSTLNLGNGVEMTVLAKVNVEK